MNMAVPSMPCPECKVTLPADARFCLSCGARLERPKPDSPADPLRDALEKAIGFQYRIERLLGRGGMGAVYLAHELALDRDVAIKVLPPERAGSREVRERFRREARTAARLSHPNIVPLYTFGEVAGLVYFVMGYVAGESLAARLQTRGPVDADEARILLAAICDALDYAHRQGIVHRDIKPDNILLDAASGTPLLTDFGIAKAAAADTQLTTVGQLMGTPDYMSPEQASGISEIGPRSDLYSLGVLAYELVSGRRPFGGATTVDALMQRLTQEPQPLRVVAPDVDGDFAAAINRCLQRDPALRWPDARSLRETLMPSDDDGTDDSPRVFPLRIGATMIPIALLAEAYLRVYAKLNPQLHTLPGVIGILVFTTTVMMMMVVATILLKREGLDARTIARKALQEPLWWRGWYPRPFRRRGDVWERLPPYVRRFRVWWSIGMLSIFVFFLPMHVVLFLSRRLDLVRFVQYPMILTAVLCAVGVRRSSKYVSRTFDMNINDARKLLLASTSRVSLWHRTPSAMRLLGYKTTSPAATANEAALSRPVPVPSTNDDSPTIG
jgi:serine/threonine protein kinase